MNTVLPTALGALQAAQAQLAGAAREIARSPAGGPDIVEAVITMKQAELQHSAAAAVARTASDMSDRLLDILA